MRRLLRISFYSLCLLSIIAVILYYRMPGVKQWMKGSMVYESSRDRHDYQPTLDTVAELRQSLARSKPDMKRWKNHFIQVMSQRVFPYWYGTPWDFNGTTQTPNEGEIACGYFVTTTLRDAGLKIDRVKMAQCASEEMIRSLVSKKHLHHLGGLSFAEFQKKLSALGQGLYVIGLDNHTGFVLLSEEGQFFIHSSGFFPFRVIREKVSESTALKRSKYKVLGKISDDEDFLKRWVNSK